MGLVVFTVVVMRDGSSVGSIWMQEVYVWLHSFIFIRCITVKYIDADMPIGEISKTTPQHNYKNMKPYIYLLHPYKTNAKSVAHYYYSENKMHDRKGKDPT